jgi:hypothetical protein
VKQDLGNATPGGCWDAPAGGSSSSEADDVTGPTMISFIEHFIAEQKCVTAFITGRTRMISEAATAAVSCWPAQERRTSMRIVTARHQQQQAHFYTPIRLTSSHLCGHVPTTSQWIAYVNELVPSDTDRALICIKRNSKPTLEAATVIHNFCAARLEDETYAAWRDARDTATRAVIPFAAPAFVAALKLAAGELKYKKKHSIDKPQMTLAQVAGLSFKVRTCVCGLTLRIDARMDCMHSFACVRCTGTAHHMPAIRLSHLPSCTAHLDAHITADPQPPDAWQVEAS